MRVFKYHIVSLITFLGNIFLAWFLVRYGGVQYIIATISGFLFQAMVAFLINKRWTFYKKRVWLLDSLLDFFGYKKIIFYKRNPCFSQSVLISLVVQMAVFFLVVAGTALGVDVFHGSFIFSRILAGVAAGLVGYCLDSYFTFNTIPFR